MQAGRKFLNVYGRPAAPTPTPATYNITLLFPTPDVPGCASMYLHTEGFPGPSPRDGTIGKAASSLSNPPSWKRETCCGGGSPGQDSLGLISEPPEMSDPQLPPQGYGYEKPVQPFPDDVCVVPEKFEGQRSYFS